MPEKPQTRRYTPEEKTAALRIVRTLRAELGTEHRTVQGVATQLGYGVESARQWVKQADIEEGHSPGVATAEASGVFLRGGTRPPAQEVVAFIDANRHDVAGGKRLGVEFI